MFYDASNRNIIPHRRRAVLAGNISPNYYSKISGINQAKHIIPSGTIGGQTYFHHKLIHYNNIEHFEILLKQTSNRKYNLPQGLLCADRPLEISITLPTILYPVRRYACLDWLENRE